MNHCEIEREDWYQGIINPVRTALCAADKPQAQLAVDTAWAETEKLQLPMDTREVITYLLLWYDLAVAVKGKPGAERHLDYAAAQTLFATPAETPNGEAQRRRLLAILRCTGRLYAGADFSRRELLELLDGLPGLEIDEFLWHNIAGWAFATSDVPMLERAYQVLLTCPSNLLGQARWQRVNLMLLLRTGKADRRDVTETIRGMEVLPQIKEFKQLIWPVCIEQGLVDAQLDRLFNQAWERLQSAPPVPRPERRTKHLRG